MKGSYGNGSHDSKVEDYSAYKKKQLNKYKSELDNIVQNIKHSSLMESDKIEFIEKLGHDILNRVTLTKTIK
jgi:hypothetical protein